MKRFEELYAELKEKIEANDPNSGTVKEFNKKGTAAQEIKQLTKEILKLINN